MTNLPLLIDAICEAFMKGVQGGIWEPSPGVTHCNEAVNFVAYRMGYSGFSGLMANDICDKLDKAEDWKLTTPVGAQLAANQGSLVVAAWKNPAGHGHVCIVRPGNPVPSPDWGMQAPKIMNIGKVNFLDKPASFAFTKLEMPRFFIWGS